MLESLGLGVDPLASIDRQHLERRVLGDLAQVLCDLDGQLARWGEDKHLARGALCDHLENREAERRRLARPGLGLSQDVAPLERDGNHVRLDLRGALVPEALHAFQEALAQAELLERDVPGEDLVRVGADVPVGRVGGMVGCRGRIGLFGHLLCRRRVARHGMTDAVGRGWNRAVPSAGGVHHPA